MVPLDEALQRAQETIEYTFRDPGLLATALTHASVSDSRLDSNERMEFLGDSILGVIVCEELFNQFPHYLEGELTKIKSAVVSRRTCALIAHEMGLADLLLLGKGMSGRAHMPSSLASAVLESVIAGVYIDGGFEAAKKLVLKHVRPHIQAAADSENQRNYKSHLQQYAQQSLQATPVYEVLDEQGPDHSKCFEVSVRLNGQRFASAWGPNKKEAEQQAARLALIEMEVLKEDPQADCP